MNILHGIMSIRFLRSIFLRWLFIYMLFCFLLSHRYVANSKSDSRLWQSGYSLKTGTSAERTAHMLLHMWSSTQTVSRAQTKSLTP